MLSDTISIHVPRAGYDPTMSPADKNSALFLSTYPVRGTTLHHTRCGFGHHISIHVPRAGYDINLVVITRAVEISIHVPRAGYDQVTMLSS